MDYTTDSNEALCISLVRAKGDADVLSGTEKNLVGEFNPKFTYPIFGEEEKIYGYEDLEIQLKFASGSLHQFLGINYTSKLSGAGSKVADDVEQTLFKFIPPDYLKSQEAFQTRVEKDATTFRPLGEKIYSYARRAQGSSSFKGKGKARIAEDEIVKEDDDDAVVYEAYWVNWDTPGFREYHRRMQMFVLLYIEGGSYIQEDEEKWEFVVLYEKRRRRDAARTETYHFVGYSSLYSFYCWPDKVRLRLSQFVIVGPYQNQGHGAALYNAIYQHTMTRDSIAELTVEDPSEAFEDLRDKCDLRMLFKNLVFMKEAYGLADQGIPGGALNAGKGAGLAVPAGKGKLGPPTNKEWAERWKKQLKIAGRQWSRLIEMLILRNLPLDDAQINRAFRLQVKERLFRFNYEILSQLDKQERHEKLEETFVSVRDDYRRILGLVE